MRARKSGFALIAALGVLTTLFVMVGTLAITSTMLYQRSGNEQVRAELSVLIDNGAEKLKQVFRNQELAEPTDMYFKFRTTDVFVHVEPLSLEDTVFSESGLTYQDGDVKAIITVEFAVNDTRYKARKEVLINIKGQREGLISLSKIQVAKGQGEK